MPAESLHHISPSVVIKPPENSKVGCGIGRKKNSGWEGFLTDENNAHHYH